MTPRFHRFATSALLALACAGTQAQTLAAGDRHALALQSDGTVLAWGDNRYGQLGQGVTLGSTTARTIAIPGTVTSVRTLSRRAMALDSQGNVWTWGRNPTGALGEGGLTGGLSQFSITARIFGGPTRASAPDGKYNVYVVAIASDGSGGPPTTWFQRNDQGQWSGVQWPMPAYATKADLGSENLSVPLDIFRNFPGQGLQNSRVYVGYGLDAYEMIDAGRLREVMVLADD